MTPAQVTAAGHGTARRTAWTAMTPRKTPAVGMVSVVRSSRTAMAVVETHPAVWSRSGNASAIADR